MSDDRPDGHATSREPQKPAEDRLRVGITAVASRLPQRVRTSEELRQEVSRRSGLPLTRGLFERATGIRSRREAADDEYASTLAIAAGRTALRRAGLDPLDIDLLVFGSASRDMAEPATAHLVQDALGSRAHALDVTNACNSFVNAIDLARSMILAGRARRALVVTGETPSRARNLAPRGAPALREHFAGYTFGDAGAAVVVEPVDRGGILDVGTRTHSEHWAVGGIPGGGSRHPRGDEHTYFRGDGHELRTVFEKSGADLLERVLRRTGTDWSDYARVLVHQVTLPYLERFCELSGVPREKLVVTADVLGNVASASLGVQLDRISDELVPGDRLFFVGLGGGISIATLVWEVS